MNAFTQSNPIINKFFTFLTLLALVISAFPVTALAVVDDSENVPVLGVIGCMDIEATNYNPAANEPDDSCEYAPATVLGCTDPLASNYNAAATEDDQSCIAPTPIIYCTDDSALNYEEEGECVYDDGLEVITACKYSSTEDPIEGWGMTITNGEEGEGEVTFDELLTEEDGCVSVSVYPEDGPFTVVEEDREGWTQQSVFTSYGQVLEGEGAEYCRYFDDNVVVLDKDIEGETFSTKISGEIEGNVISAPEYRCEFYNEEVVAPVCKNLLTNGSFEEPTVTNNDLWQKFASVAGWVIEKVTDSTPTTLEVHRGWSGNDAAEGEQYVELDGDHSTKVLQNVPTIPGAVYELSWAFAPRHNISADQNQMSVAIDGVEVDTEGPATAGAGLTSGDWTRSSYNFSATDTSIDISFADKGPSDSYGTYLDDAVLCLVREPEIDLCPNLEDNQVTVPEGYVLNNAGQCVPEIINTCLVPSTLGDESEFVINDSGEKTVAEMLADHGYVAVDTTNDQVNYQVWNLVDPSADTITFNVKVLGKRAGNTEILGYYKAGDGSTFSAVLTQVSDTDGEVVVPVTIPAIFANSFGFGIKSADMTWYSEKSLNLNGEDHVAVYNPAANTYLLAFEDLRTPNDGDYNDLVIEIADVTCVPPPPPVDMCENLEGVQEYVPKGMYQNQAGDCLPLEDDEIINTCLVPSTLGDESEFVINNSGEKTVAEMLADHGYVAIDTTNDQINYQVWNLVDPSADTITFNVKVLGKRAGNTQILGYYKAGDGSTFTSVLTQVTDTDGEVSIPVTIPAAFASSFGFGIKSDDMTWFSEKSLNLDTKDHVAVYNPVANKYLLAFEDFNNLGDADYNDLVIEIADVRCAQDGDEEIDEQIPTDNNSSSRGGGGSRSNRSGTPEVLGDSTSTVEPTPYVLGDQVTAVPYGAPAAGHGGSSNGPVSAMTSIIQMLTATTPSRFKMPLVSK
jgi:Domain of unknown function (DUF4114)/Protein of unknown function (DUF642)